jgi:hypothetical protein
LSGFILYAYKPYLIHGSVFVQLGETERTQDERKDLQT